MLMLRIITWISAGLALVVLISAMALFYLIGDQINYTVTLPQLLTRSYPALLVLHEAALGLSIVLLLVFSAISLRVTLNRWALTLMTLVIGLLLLNDLAFDFGGVFSRLDEHQPDVSFYLHFGVDSLLVWCWYWLSLRIQGPILSIVPSQGVRIGALVGAFLMVLSYVTAAIQGEECLGCMQSLKQWLQGDAPFSLAGTTTQTLSLLQTLLDALSLVVVWCLAILAIVNKQSSAIRQAGWLLGVLLLLKISTALLQLDQASSALWIQIASSGVSVLLMLPLIAISFYSRYAVGRLEQPLVKPAPGIEYPEAETSTLVRVTVPDVEQPYVEPAPESLYLRLKTQLKRTRSGLGNILSGIALGQRKIDADLLEEIESSLIMADVGMDAAMEIIGRLTEKTERQELNNAETLSIALKQELLDMLKPCSEPLVIPKQDKPYVILVVGINGVGKTTTIGKIAKRLQAQGHSVMLAAGDTFRAAAVEQLQVWGQRNNIHVVAQHTGADSASVIYDGVQSALAKGVDVLIADTAGRLHTKSNLMEELKKVKRIMAKLDETAPHEVLLVLDAGTGQNALSQTKLFNETVALTGLVLTKLDGTAKGGIIFALAKQFGLPIRYIGIGEGIDDLQNFDATAFVDALFVKDD